MKQSGKLTGNVEVAGDCAYYRPAGKVTLEEAIEALDQAIAYVRRQRIPKLLFNGRGLTGFPAPSLPERYFAVRRFAATSQSQVQVAIVIHAEMIDPEKFGVTVARNSGLNADVFMEESEALAWLQSQPEK